MIFPCFRKKKKKRKKRKKKPTNKILGKLEYLRHIKLDYTDFLPSALQTSWQYLLLRKVMVLKKIILIMKNNRVSELDSCRDNSRLTDNKAIKK